MKLAHDFKNIVVLTGAGISAESGIKTFRASDGLWENHRIEDVASPEGFSRDPELVHQFYNQRRAHLLREDIKPNAAHQTLAQFEQQHPGSFLLVTQNIDDLHDRAGSKNLIHLHGELLKIRCALTGHLFDWRGDCDQHSVCPHCHSAGHLRPHVVWFGEMPLQMEAIYDALEQCDLFVSIGTSGHVYPAAGFVQIARQCGAHCVELNLESSQVVTQFHQSHNGKATELVPEFFAY